MILNSFVFFVFISFVLLLYWKISPKYQWLVLLLSGYIFYASWKPVYLLLMIFSSIINYFLSIAIHNGRQYRKEYFILAVAFNLSVLFIFKYFNFFSSSLNETWKIFHWRLHLPQLNWILPLGISFYTLQVIGYLSNIYSGKTQPEKHFRFFALFHCFFPQLSAGPIMRGEDLLPQFKKHHIFEYSRVTSGMKLFTYGLFKKMVIADNLGIIVDRVFGSLPEFKGLSLMIAVFFYSWQIYTDFSGYTDMARGIGRMLGIELMENFNFPYFAASVRDFWRRWHISLTSWLRDYIYFPLGGSRRGYLRVIINTLIVFTLSGLWHGAGWHFVVWGTLNGLWMSMERIVKNNFSMIGRFPRILQIIYAYLIVSIFWIFFRVQTLQEAAYVLRNSFLGIKNIYQPDYIWASLNQVFIYNKAEMAITFCILSIALISEIIRRYTSLEQLLSKRPAAVRFIFYSFIVFLIIQLRNSDIKEFIYTKF